MQQGGCQNGAAASNRATAPVHLRHQHHPGCYCKLHCNRWMVSNLLLQCVHAERSLPHKPTAQTRTAWPPWTTDALQRLAPAWHVGYQLAA